MTWCAPNCETYLIIRWSGWIIGQPWSNIQAILAQASDDVTVGLRDAYSQALVPGGQYSCSLNGLYLQTQNTNNHQQTWEVLGAAITALAEYYQAMQSNGAASGSVIFTIYDGANAVGQGSLNLATSYSG